MRACAVIGVMLAFLAGAARGATQAQIDVARDKAAAWLIGQQLGEGRWTTGRDADIPVTAQALMGLTSVGVRGIPARNATTWLLNSKADSIDALARSLLALTSPNARQNAGFLQLISWANNEFSVGLQWGSYPGYSTSVPDSALAWRALLTVGYALDNRSDALGKSLCTVFLSQQHPDGSWGLVVNPWDTSDAPTPTQVTAGAVFTTTQTMAMLLAAKAREPVLQNFTCVGQPANIVTTINTAVSAAANWLTTTVKNPDGGIGEGGTSSLVASVQAYTALQLVRPADPGTTGLLGYLLAKQSANGSWNNDPMLTGQMLEALGHVATVGPDTDADGIPDSIEIALGQNPAAFDPNGMSSKSNGVGRPGINLPLSLASRLVVNLPYTSGALPVSGGVPPYTWSTAGGALPPGLALNPATGIISGTPTTIGTYTFAYAAQDSTGASGTVVGQLTVVRTPPGTGDINGDGVVDLADVILAQRIALGLMTPTAQQRQAADVAPLGDPDGVIDASDVALILRKALGIDSF